jgi:hypothetical protein
MGKNQKKNAWKKGASKTIEGFGRIFKPRYTRKAPMEAGRFIKIRFGGLPTITTARSTRKQRFKGRKRGNQILKRRVRFGPWHRWQKEERVTFE